MLIKPQAAKSFIALLFYFAVPSFGVLIFWLETLLLLVVLGAIWFPNLVK